MICSAGQWTGCCVVAASVMGGLIALALGKAVWGALGLPRLWNGALQVWRGEWALAYHFFQFRHFPNIS